KREKRQDQVIGINRNERSQSPKYAVDVSHEGQGILNPLIDTATQTKNEIEMVINRLEGGFR
ncbi:hypothetical protein, partial [Vibrio cholerae]|uniref:hypothetical protein n=1 Tax=Vibrio cholerae TaxID=666 RepID=UPI001CA3313A